MGRRMQGIGDREEDMMNMLWDCGKAMTSVDLENALSADKWNHAAIFRTIKSLHAKGMIEECGTELRGKQWTRKFKPVVTKEEFMAQFLIDRGIDTKSLGKVAAAVVNKSKKSKAEDEKLIKELESIIKIIRNRITAFAIH